MEQVKILVADDERIERSILCRKISRVLGECCQIIQAENGREAVSLFEEKRPQIAVLDIAMPGINGIEAAARIRQMDSDCILIFLTAYSDFHYSVQAIRLRALDYLTKPCDNDELFAVLETAVYQAQSRLEKEEQGQP
ncbi:MAG: response regulator, partial [Eubacteriales bacterium]|nr:response regulator [Eubacteriales bacterium]